MKRMFIALDLPEQLKTKIIDLQKSIQNDHELETHYKWTKIDQVHLTLIFFGDITTEQSQYLKERIQKISISPFQIILNGLGFFKKGKFAPILFIKLQEEKKLLLLQNELSKVAETQGIKIEKRKFSPHITIARTKKTHSSVAEKLVIKFQEAINEKIAVNKFILYSSLLKSDGSIHTPELIIDLGNL